MEPAFRHLIRFDAYALDLRRCALTHGAQDIQLRPKAFDTLRYLAEHAGRVISKEELLTAVWRDVIVTEDSLVQCVKEARDALSDSSQRIIKTVPRRGYLFAAQVQVSGVERQHPNEAPDQQVTFSRTRDGVNLAMAVVGRGTQLVCVPTWASHLEHDWDNPTRGELWWFLANRYQLIRYDGRGFGLSDRNVPEISPTTFELDLEAVIHALNLRRCAIFAISQGCAAAIALAARYPQRVAKLVLLGAFAQGRNKRGSIKEIEFSKAFISIMRQGWDDGEAALLRMLSASWLPGASPDRIRWFANLLRSSTTAENAIRNRQASDDIDVLNLLSKVRAPTLVLHSKQDNSVPFSEGRRVAALVANARFVTLDSENHVPLPEEPAWPQLLRAIEAFLS